MPRMRMLFLDIATAVVSWANLHRQRIARVLLVGAVCFGATRVWPAVPQTTDVRFELGPQHREIMELQVGFLRDGEPVKGASFRFPEGAPETVRHEVMLPTGRYDLQVRCRRAQGTTSVERVIVLPNEGVLRVHVAGGKV